MSMNSLFFTLCPALCESEVICLVRFYSPQHGCMSGQQQPGIQTEPVQQNTDPDHPEDCPRDADRPPKSVGNSIV